MNKKTISALLGKINIVDSHGNIETEITGFCVDSRVYSKGEMYVAQTGVHNDGHTYIPDVINKGCRAVLYSSDLPEYKDDVVYIRVENTRKALSPIAAAFFEHPSQSMKVIGVTGTDGKSSTVSYIHQLLELLQFTAGFTSTVEYKIQDIIEKNPFRMSTPESFEIQKLMQNMVQNKKEYAVIESTSHGLSKTFSRLSDVEYNIAVLTNISHEHLEFHGTIEQYANDKANLFRQLKQSNDISPVGIIRKEEPFSSVFYNAFNGTWLSYSTVDSSADAFAEDIKETSDGISFLMSYKNRKYSCFIPLSGLFNVQNILASFLAVISATKTEPELIIKAFKRLKPVKGRMETVKIGQPFKAIVDYAHSPGSFEKLLPMIKASTQGKLIVLFGSAGERDTAKRPIQGKLAADYADIIVLSDEDPRKEDSMTILREIAYGCNNKTENVNLFLIPDRKAGIRKALELASDKDTVLFLGKGHESSIIYGDGKIPWDEAKLVKSQLIEMGYGHSSN